MHTISLCEGRISFATWDTSSNGTIEEQEFNTIREQRQTMVKSRGHMGKNLPVVPTFVQINTDNDATITSAELTAMQQSQWNNQSTTNHHDKNRFWHRVNVEWDRAIMATDKL